VEEIPPEPAPTYQFIWPAWGGINQYFGCEFTCPHNGIDIGISYGTVAAAASGTVTIADWYGGCGYTVGIDHGNGYSTLYCHLSEVWVGWDQWVNQGDAIGVSGNTGYSTGPHLHFELHEWGYPVNPLAYLP
jgi:murein DD-endopeptidase MepM/ murein hydrolase activator NlpD